MTRPLYAIGRLAARRHLWFIGAWIALAIGLVVLAALVGKPTSDDLTIPGSDSTAATDLLDAKLPSRANGSVPVAMKVDSGRLDQGEKKTAVKKTVAVYRADDRIRAVTSPFSEAGADQLTKDGRIGYINLDLVDGPGDLDEEDADALIALASPLTKAGIEHALGAYVGQEVSEPATESSEVIGLAVAIVVLAFAFGTLVAMPLPIVTALFGLSVGLSLIGLLGHILEVPSIAATLGTMLGLGVGIDYALFIVTRYRGFLAEGHGVEESVARATATSGGAVLFAGSTVVIALLSLYFGGIPLVRALGYSAAVVVAVAVVAAITLLPAILGLLGERINKGRLPIKQHHHDDQPHGWARWARGIGRHPLSAAVAGTAILLALAFPLLDISLGQPDDGQLPTDTETRQSWDILTEGFGAGANGPLLVSVDLDPPAKPNTKKLKKVEAQQQQQEQQAQQQYEQEQEQYQEAASEAAAAGESPPKPPPPPPQPSAKQQQEQKQQKEFLKSPASDPRLVKLGNQISKDPDVDDVSLPALNKAGTAAAIQVTPDSSPVSERTVDLVNRLRDDTIPDTLTGDTTAYVGGSTASYIDLADKIGKKLPLVIAIVVALSFLLLMVAFRSIVVPLTAGLMNLISVAASYGVLVLVFEKGVGLELIGLDREIPIVSFVPLLMFAILFGLSMDYQVFLLTKIQERFKAGVGNHDSVVEGLAGTARVITSAATIMVAVFASFILNGDPTVKQFGVGLAVAVAIDATIVRCVLVPATMILLGRANWWFPDFLERHMPHVGIEGEEFFEKLDASGPGADRVGGDGGEEAGSKQRAAGGTETEEPGEAEAEGKGQGEA